MLSTVLSRAAKFLDVGEPMLSNMKIEEPHALDAYFLRSLDVRFIAPNK